MPLRETGKRRAQGIPLDYYKYPDPIHRAKFRLAIVAVAAAGLWWASGINLLSGSLGTNGAGKLRSSKGPLASVHQAWDSQCEACHRAFESIDGKRWSPPLLVKSSAETDRLCQSCHKGTAHHPSQRAEDVKSCAGCHIDHQGRDASLVRLADSECTSCHADLGRHRKEGAKPAQGIAAAIRSFVDGHPKFSTEINEPKDPGRLKEFSHARHLTPGIAKTAGGRDAKTLAYIRDPVARERYRKKNQADDTIVQLDCASCHVADGSDFPGAGLAVSATLPPRSSGAAMLPITYENQCKACHPLTFDPRSPELVAPHGKQPGEIRKFLWNTYAGTYLKDDAKLLTKPVRPNPILGRGVESDEKTVKETIDRVVHDAEATLYGGSATCLECHKTQGVAEGRPQTIVSPDLPSLWFKKARFDHSAHRGVGCIDCHSNARESKESIDILIPGVESCRKCHAPSSSSGRWVSSNVAEGGVRFDCTECHKYHDADHPLKGKGALSEAGTSVRDVAAFLKGSEGGSNRTKSP